MHRWNFTCHGATYYTHADTAEDALFSINEKLGKSLPRPGKWVLLGNGSGRHFTWSQHPSVIYS